LKEHRDVRSTRLRTGALVATLAVASACTVAALSGDTAARAAPRSEGRARHPGSSAAWRVDREDREEAGPPASPAPPTTAEAPAPGRAPGDTGPDDADWTRGNERAVAAALLARLEEGEPGVETVEAALANDGFRAYLPHLRLPRPEPDAVARRLRALGNAAGSADPALRELSMRGFKDLGAAARDAEPLVAKALADPDPLVRAAAARALGEVGSGPLCGGGALARATADDEPAVRRAAVDSLGDLAREDDSGSAVATVAARLGDRDAGVREAAAASAAARNVRGP
jgi:hypothetical protein